MNRISDLVLKHHLINQLLNVTTGIEVERDRTNLNGSLSTYPYPKGIGNQADNPWITNDFLEAMSEAVTPPAKTPAEAVKYSYDISIILRKRLNQHEILWPMSMPPTLPKDQTDQSLLAHAAPKKRQYIIGLYHRFGMAKQTPCGIHVNMSLENSVIDQIASLTNSTSKRVRNHLYLKVAQGFIKYHWLLTYFFGASPIAQPRYFKSDQEHPDHPVRSLRQSKYGYPSSFAGEYTSINDYVQRIKDGINQGILMSPAEFYDVVRFKGYPNLDQLKSNGIKYLEFRMFDLDPTSEAGIKISTIQFVSLMMLYFIMKPAMNQAQVTSMAEKARKMNEEVALENPTNTTSYADEAHQFIHELLTFTNQFNLGPKYLEILNDLDHQIDCPKLTINGHLSTYIKNGSLLDYGIKQAVKYQKHGLQNPFDYDGFKNGDFSGNDLIKFLNQF
ncbi:glutamate--cysteine ligase [Philodulcilactobacillus myokoensis]|uniref:Glutamate--cysteine ligase n=1 Tax=Philodulcilactobacillus myokoensis TaxID=2929573 RepID=A0A9W6B3R5_9LACO|nr:glutamate--cysteine ligase [Philodulcilactobacillus myokoensis]GLB47535.1 glutamate--cysteine ligase [Philodulcilactobacillus myokoensis]